MSAELPRGWRHVKVRDAGRVQLGRQRSPDVHSGSNMRPYLRVANVYEDRIDLSDVMQMHFDPREVERFELVSGDILLNEGQSRELVGRPAMYRGELPGACFTNSLVRFQALPSVENRYALALFRHWLRIGAFQAKAQITTNIAHLGAGRFAEMKFPLPPLNEQRRIVAKLEALQARSRRAREALDAIPPLLEKLRQSILAAAFRGDLTREWRAKNPDVEPASELLKRIRVERRAKWEEAELAKTVAKGKPPKDDTWKAKYEEPKPVDASGLPELPKGWCWASVEEISWAQEYGTSAKSSDAGDVPVLAMGNIVNGHLAFLRMKYLPKEHAEFPALLLVPGDVLFNRTNSPELVGKTAVYDGDPNPCSFASYLIRVRTALYEPYVLAAYINSPRVRAWVAEQVTQQTGQANLSGSKLRSLAVPVPPLAEQRELSAALRQGHRRSTGLGHALTSASAVQDQLDRAILAKAFRGELVPQDPNDEPVVLPSDVPAPSSPAKASKRAPSSAKPSRRKASS